MSLKRLAAVPVRSAVLSIDPEERESRSAADDLLGQMVNVKLIDRRETQMQITAVEVNSDGLLALDLEATDGTILTLHRAGTKLRCEGVPA